MADRFLKHMPTGQVFIFQSHFAVDPAFVEVADAAGNPLPDAIDAEFERVEEVAPKKTRAKKVAVAEDLDADIDAALSADASRGL